MIIVDCETTGLEPYRHALVSVGAVKYEEQHKTFYSEMKPIDGTEISERALEVNGYSYEYLQAIETTTTEALRKFGKWVNWEVEASYPMHFIGGFNTHFDAEFINVSYQRVIESGSYMSPPYFDFHYLDLYSVFQSKIGPMEHPGIGLKRICEYLGVKPEPEPHNALNGAKKTAECLRILLEEY